MDSTANANSIAFRQLLNVVPNIGENITWIALDKPNEDVAV